MVNEESRFSGNERKYLLEVLDSEFRGSRYVGMMQRFESTFASKFNAEYAISFVNGTATMHAALEAIGVGPGDEVIVPPLTMSSTTFAVLQANATPIFADVDEKTFQISAESIGKCVTKNTKAIITVSLYGLSPDMDAIMSIANENNIFVLEDNAECFYGRYKGRLAGSSGHCASYSFQSSKHLTSGEGGVVVTNDLDLAEKIRRIQSLGYAGVSASKGKISKKEIQDPTYSRHVSMGWNYRMPELCCAVALAQTENIELLVRRRLDVAAMFSEAVEGYESWFIPQKVGSEYEHSYWTWVALLNHHEVEWNKFRDKFMEFGGDGVYAAWKLTYMEPFFQERKFLGRENFISEDNLLKYKVGLCPIAEKIQPKLMQFKTNYMSLETAKIQANILRKTLAYFDRNA